MPDRRRLRGPAPQDESAFAQAEVPCLQTACSELSWMLSRGYSSNASLKLTGDRHRLTTRQRKALQRTAASDDACALRSGKCLTPESLAGKVVEIDGYNVLLTVEAALSGGVLLLGRDGAMRDLAALSRHFKRLDVTVPALHCIGRWLSDHRVLRVNWWFDRPISNSGRLAEVLRQESRDHQWPWNVELVASPDRVLKESSNISATADSAILDRCHSWINLARHVVEDTVATKQKVWLVDLSLERAAPHSGAKD